jgi:hypothetical protein
MNSFYLDFCTYNFFKVNLLVPPKNGIKIYVSKNNKFLSVTHMSTILENIIRYAYTYSQD